MFVVRVRWSYGQGQRLKSIPSTRSSDGRGHLRLHGHVHAASTSPLATTADKTEALTKNLTRYGSGEAYVEADEAPLETKLMSVAATKARPRLWVEHSANLPQDEFRLPARKGSNFELEIWQLPTPATPRLMAPETPPGSRSTPPAHRAPASQAATPVQDQPGLLDSDENRASEDRRRSGTEPRPAFPRSGPRCGTWTASVRLPTAWTISAVKKRVTVGTAMHRKYSARGSGRAADVADERLMAIPPIPSSRPPPGSPLRRRDWEQAQVLAP